MEHIKFCTLVISAFPNKTTILVAVHNPDLPLQCLVLRSSLFLCLSTMLGAITTLENVPADSTGGGWQPHTMTTCEIYTLHVCWPGLIIQSNAGEDPSMSRALNGSSR